MMGAARAFAELVAALDAAEPACDGDTRFIDDGRADSANADLAPICASCPVLDPCGAYASAAPRHAIVGYWAGARRGTRPRAEVPA